MKKIEFRDLGRQYKKNKRLIDKAIKNVISRSQFISGPEVEELEKKIADYVGVNYCISCANGTDAMSLVLMAWNIGPGDAVFVPDFTFIATAEVVSLRGATPIFVDVDERTFNMDADDLERAISEVLEKGELTPKVIIPVDLYGLPADFPALEKIAKKYSLLVLEDAAQGFGGSINGQMACSFGDAATTSFFPAKPLGCYGDGGAILTNDKSLAGVLYSLRVHGMGDNKYDNIRIGTNSRLDTIQAAILIEKINILDSEIKEINKIAKFYNLRLTESIVKPLIASSFKSSYAQYTIKLSSKEERDGLMRELSNHAIPSTIFYPKTLSKQKVFLNNEHTRSGNNSVLLSERVLSIPIHPYLCKRELNLIITVINNFFVT
jgi:UDP-2-acetamido-2-deoxy-ribo-hexuluronate aminotransferase